MLSACLITLPAEALNRMMNHTVLQESGGRRIERRAALFVVTMAMAIGAFCAVVV